MGARHSLQGTKRDWERAWNWRRLMRVILSLGSAAPKKVAQVERRKIDERVLTANKKLKRNTRYLMQFMPHPSAMFDCVLILPVAALHFANCSSVFRFNELSLSLLRLGGWLLSRCHVERAWSFRFRSAVWLCTDRLGRKLAVYLLTTSIVWRWVEGGIKGRAEKRYKRDERRCIRVT